MKVAYLVCFVALLQICMCRGDVSESTETLPSSTPTEFMTLNSTDPETNDTTITETASTSDATTNTADDEEVAVSQSYQTPSSEATTDVVTTTKGSTEERSTTVKPSGQGVPVYPTALVVLVPLCLRLVSINLVGVV